MLALNNRTSYVTMVFVILLLALTSTNAAVAAITYSVDINRDDSGVQASRTATAADQFTADIILIVEPATTLANYAISLRFDADELEFVSGTEVAPPGLTSFNPITVSGTDSSVLLGIEAGGFGGGVGAGTYNIASLTFNVINPTGDNTDLDLILFEDSILDGSFAGDFSQLTPTLNGAAVTASAVPEPSAAWLLVVLGMAVRRRRCRDRYSR